MVRSGTVGNDSFTMQLARAHSPSSDPAESRPVQLVDEFNQRNGVKAGLVPSGRQ